MSLYLFSFIASIYDPVLCGPNNYCEYSNKCLGEAAGFLDCKQMNQSEQLEVDPTVPVIDPLCPLPGAGIACSKY